MIILIIYSACLFLSVLLVARCRFLSFDQKRLHILLSIVLPFWGFLYVLANRGKYVKHKNRSGTTAYELDSDDVTTIVDAIDGSDGDFLDFD
ncbi:MAG TPA: hypothetical protein VK177_14145 [Flavobacteriales bacterium]|nr:hypothetical protein [Flavobacteriales bacterium]